MTRSLRISAVGVVGAPRSLRRSWTSWFQNGRRRFVPGATRGRPGSRAARDRGVARGLRQITAAGGPSRSKRSDAQRDARNGAIQSDNRAPGLAPAEVVIDQRVWDWAAA